MRKETLNRVLDAHLTWARSGRTGEFDLEGVNFSKADLGGASLAGANLHGAVFAEARLERADLRDADLRSVSFRNACLRNADLRGARVDGAVFEGADLTGAVMPRPYVYTLNGGPVPVVVYRDGYRFARICVGDVQHPLTRWERDPDTPVDHRAADWWPKNRAWVLAMARTLADE